MEKEIHWYYTKSINRVIDYIENHVTGDLSLDKLADIGGFSKYHFHKIFKVITEETLNGYVKRLKMETAMRRLNRDPSLKMIDLAMELGYPSHANFSRDFQRYFQVSPSRARRTGIPKKESLSGEDLDIDYQGVIELSNMTVVYDRLLTGYDPLLIPEVFSQLYERIRILDPNGIYIKPVGIAYDDPDITPLHKCRYDACFELDTTVSPIPRNSDLNVKKIEGGLYCCFSFKGAGPEIFKAWDQIFQKWIIRNHYIPLEKPNLEFYYPSEEYGDGIFNARLFIPVKSISA